jgi:hypothetical protein
LDAAAEAYRQAIEWRADFVSAKFNLALTQLLQGSFVEGFTGFEARWDLPDLAKTRQHFSQPQWDGSDLNGRTILLHAEQGIGDTIQFIRYAPLVAQRGGRVVFQCPEAMTRLFEGFPGIDRFVVRGRELPEFDLHCPLLSLPLAMKTTLETIPASVPYLSADAESVSRWRKRLPRDSVNVGLAWAGRAEHSNDRLRSMALTDFAPLVDAPGVNFFSLQKGDAAEQLRSTPDGLAITDWTEQLQDLSDTAALIDALDLVITVDTSVAHLAGALGKPVWVLLPFAPDWRWMLDRSDSPWYPTMRLFRQPQARDWRSPVEQVAQALHTFQVPAR